MVGPFASELEKKIGRQFNELQWELGSGTAVAAVTSWLAGVDMSILGLTYMENFYFQPQTSRPREKRTADRRGRGRGRAMETQRSRGVKEQRLKRTSGWQSFSWRQLQRWDVYMEYTRYIGTVGNHASPSCQIVIHIEPDSGIACKQSL